MSSEKREYERFDREVTIQIITLDGDTVLTTKTANLSDGGAMLLLPSECLLNEGIEVQVTLTTGQSEPLVCTGTVVRKAAEDDDGAAGLGIRFSEPMKLQLENIQDAASEESDW